MVRSTRCILTKTGCQIEVKLAQTSFEVSYGTIINLKPFSVQKPTESKKESCLCKFSLNLGLPFNELNNLLADKLKIAKSMTKYFSKGCKCKNPENGYEIRS